VEIKTTLRQGEEEGIEESINQIVVYRQTCFPVALEVDHDVFPRVYVPF
jgi:hypothetical protein